MPGIRANSPTKKITILFLCAAIVAVAFVAVRIYGILTKDAAVVHVTPTAFDSPENQQLLESDPISGTLMFSFSLARGASNPFRLASIGEYNGRPHAQVTTPGDYSFSVIEDGAPVYTTNFSIKPDIVEDFDEDGTIRSVEVDTRSEYSLITPRFKDGSTYMIRDSAGTIVLESTIGNVVVHNNTPNYKTYISN